MNQEQFIAAHEEKWRRLENWAKRNHKRKPNQEQEQEMASPDEFASLYRQTCQHLALARSRLYSHHLIQRLHQVVLQSHEELYGAQRNVLQNIMHYILAGFPAAVRREWRLVLGSGLLFYLPFLGMTLAVIFYPDMVYTVLDHHSLRDLEYMYDPAHRDTLGRTPDRTASTDLVMFGFYIRNNTGIGLQTFASGLLLGVGSVFTLLFNGLYIGAASGYLTHLGFNETFWSFVIGHGSLELNAIVLSGAAGLRIGLAILAPRRRTRLRALREDAQKALLLMYGAAGMFILAAAVEAFWSPASVIPANVKYIVGGIMWLLVFSYFIFGGRGATR